MCKLTFRIGKCFPQGLSLTVLLLFWQPCIAQTESCFEEQRRKGIEELNKARYNNAINIFFAALTCPSIPLKHDIFDQIKKAQNAIEIDLTSKTLQAVALEKEARKSLEIANNAQQAEAIARADAEKNAAVAREKGIQAEMLRLAILADIQRINNNATEALFLGYLSIKLAGERVTPAQLRSFAQAVWDTLRQPIATSELPLKSIYPLSNGKDYLGLLEDHHLVLLRGGKALPINIGTEPFSGDKVMAFAGDKFLLGSSSGRAWLWTPGSNTSVPVDAHTESILTTGTSSDGKYWLTASRDNQAKLWSAEGTLLRSFSGHTGNVYGAIFSTDGQLVLTRSSDGSLRLWNVHSGVAIRLPDAPAYCYDVQFSVSSLHILAAGHDGKLYRWDLQGNPLSPIPLHQGPIRQLLFSPNQHYLLTKGADSTLSILNAEMQLLAQFGYREAPILVSAMDAQEQFLAMGLKNRNIHLYHISSKETQVLRGHQDDIVGLEFSKDGKTLLSTSKDGVVRLWDVQGNLLLEVNTGKTSTPIAAKFSLDGQRIVTSNTNNLTIVECPTPENAIFSMKQQEQKFASKIEQIKKTYNVQFLE